MKHLGSAASEFTQFAVLNFEAADSASSLKLNFRMNGIYQRHLPSASLIFCKYMFTVIIYSSVDGRMLDLCLMCDNLFIS